MSKWWTVLRLTSTWAVSGCLAFGCAAELPVEVRDYATRCIKMNPEPIPSEGDEDPHRGVKDVYACGLEESALFARTPGEPWPEGTVIVKESTMPEQGFPWLVATMSKRDGAWQWAEYTRNFEDEAFLEILAPTQVCVDCHRKVEVADWVFTVPERAP